MTAGILCSVDLFVCESNPVNARRHLRQLFHLSGRRQRCSRMTTAASKNLLWCCNSLAFTRGYFCPTGGLSSGRKTKIVDVQEGIGHTSQLRFRKIGFELRVAHEVWSNANGFAEFKRRLGAHQQSQLAIPRLIQAELVAGKTQNASLTARRIDTAPHRAAPDGALHKIVEHNGTHRPQHPDGALAQTANGHCVAAKVFSRQEQSFTGASAEVLR